jgi:thioredoxin reductase
MHIKKISMVPGVRDYKEITREGLTIINKDGNEQILEAGSIITALPVAPDTSLLEQLTDKVPELYAIGDCREPGLIAHAVADGAKTGRKV